MSVVDEINKLEAARQDARRMAVKFCNLFLSSYGKDHAHAFTFDDGDVGVILEQADPYAVKVPVAALSGKNGVVIGTFDLDDVPDEDDVGADELDIGEVTDDDEG